MKKLLLFFLLAFTLQAAEKPVRVYVDEEK